MCTEQRERVVYDTKRLFFRKIISVLFIILFIFLSIKSVYAEKQTIETSNIYHIYDCGTAHITSKSGKLLYCVVPFGFAPDSGETVSFNTKNITTSTGGNDQKLAKILYYGYGGGGNILTDYSNSEAEAITHFALSKVWVHDMQSIGSNLKNYWNCTAFSTSTFINSSGVNKVNNFLSRIDSLPNVSGTLHISKNYEAGVSADQDLIYGEFSCGGKVTLIKLSDRADLQRLYPVKGAKFTLYTDSNCTNIAKDTSNNNAIFTIGDNNKSQTLTINPGTYYLDETTLPAHYKKDETLPRTITVKSGDNKSFTIKNYLKYGKLQVIKKSDRPDKVTEYPITGAEFSLYADSSCTTIAKDLYNKPIKFIIDKSGKSNIVEVLEGTFYLKETKVPQNYSANNDVIKVNVVDKDFEKLEVINELKPGLGRVQKKY